MTNKEKFQKLVYSENTGIVEENKARIKNRDRLRASQDIALKVLNRLNDLGWKQKKLASEMDVSAQQITKVVSGKENLTLETIVKLEKVLGISILVSSLQMKLHEHIKESITEYFNASFFNGYKYGNTIKIRSLDSFEKKNDETVTHHQEQDTYATIG